MKSNIINKFGQGLEKTFKVKGNTFAICQNGEDYNGTLTLYENGRECSFCCYESDSDNYCDIEEALTRLIKRAEKGFNDEYVKWLNNR